jgi:hypothetical protein
VNAAAGHFELIRQNVPPLSTTLMQLLMVENSRNLYLPACPTAELLAAQ